MRDGLCQVVRTVSADVVAVPRVGGGRWVLDAAILQVSLDVPRWLLVWGNATPPHVESLVVERSGVLAVSAAFLSAVAVPLNTVWVALLMFATQTGSSAAATWCAI
jgi:hypothetical protein